jgi:hypothetical protein
VHTSCSTSSDNRVRVLLYVTDTSPAFIFLNCDWVLLSISSNFVTWNKAYSLFPYLTFVQREGYYLMSCIDSAMDHDSGRQLRAVSAAGYKLKDLGWYPKQYDVIARRRRFGDKHSWIIDLPTQGVTASKLPDGAIGSSAFTIMKQDNEDSEASTTSSWSRRSSATRTWCNTWQVRSTTRRSSS